MHRDTNGDGLVSKAELRRACEQVGFANLGDELGALFDELDVTRDGKISYAEINKALRQGAAITLPPELQPGGLGVATSAAKAHFSAGRPPPARPGAARHNIAREFADYPDSHPAGYRHAAMEAAATADAAARTYPAGLRWRPDTRRPANYPLAAVRITVLEQEPDVEGQEFVRVRLAF